MKRRRSRNAREARDQFSFDLPELREEARRIATAAEHQAFLQQGKKRAQAAIAELEAEIGRVARNAAHIAISSGDHFQITLGDHGENRVIADRREAGEALRALMLAHVTDEDVVALGRFAGLAMYASIVREGEDVFWAPRLVGERSWFRNGTVNEGSHAKLSPHSGARRTFFAWRHMAVHIVSPPAGRTRKKIVTSLAVTDPTPSRIGLMRAIRGRNIGAS